MYETRYDTLWDQASVYESIKWSFSSDFDDVFFVCSIFYESVSPVKENRIILSAEYQWGARKKTSTTEYEFHDLVFISSEIRYRCEWLGNDIIYEFIRYFSSIFVWSTPRRFSVICFFFTHAYIIYSRKNCVSAAVWFISMYTLELIISNESLMQRQ